MPLPLDAYTWTLEQTQEEIAVRLPNGWGFDIDQVEGNFWQVTILNEAKEPVWQEQDVAANLVLFNALGWLDLRNAKPKVGPWAPRRRDIDARTVHEEAFRKMVSEDPPDLDPKEVESVYCRHPHKR